jgi:hypothetical protein
MPAESLSISLTRLRLRHPRFFPRFIWYAAASLKQARRAPGCVFAQVRATGGLTFWTLSAWQSEAAMKAYMVSGAHLKAMPGLRRWCDEAATARWAGTPGCFANAHALWSEGERRLAAEGRFHHVDHPSPDQSAGRLPGASRG